MKNKLIALFASTVGLLAAPESDLAKGIDLTAKTTLTTSMFNQLVDNGTIGTNKGILYASKTAPVVSSNVRYTNFLWLDLNFNPPAVKQWISGVTMTNPDQATNWANIGFAAGSIFGYMISPNTISSTNIGTNAISYAYQIANNVVDVQHLKDKSITAAKLVNNSVTNGIIADGAITDAKLTNNAIGVGKLQANIVFGSNIVSGSLSNSHMSAACFTNSVWDAGTNWLHGRSVFAGSVLGTSITNQGITSNQIAYAGIHNTNLGSTIPRFLTGIVRWNGAVAPTYTPSTYSTRTVSFARLGTGSNSCTITPALSAAPVFASFTADRSAAKAMVCIVTNFTVNGFTIVTPDVTSGNVQDWDTGNDLRYMIMFHE